MLVMSRPNKVRVVVGSQLILRCQVIQKVLKEKHGSSF